MGQIRFIAGEPISALLGSLTGGTALSALSNWGECMYLFDEVAGEAEQQGYPSLPQQQPPSYAPSSPPPMSGSSWPSYGYPSTSSLGPLSPEVAAEIAPDDRAFSATAIEAWVGCPVKWFVEKLLNPQELVPDPEALVRGQVAHAVLAETFAGLDGRPLTPAALPAARERMHDSLAATAAAQPISVNQERLRSEVRRLEADLVRYLEHAARDGSEFGPVVFEQDFRADLGPFVLHGRIDRVDARGGEAVVVDYKGKSATPVARW